MFFLLSKTLYYILMPATWLLALTVLILVVRSTKKKRRLSLLLLILVLVFSNNFLANWLMQCWEVPAVNLSQLESYDIGIVLGGIVQTYQTPNDRVHLQRGADRILHALLLYRKGYIRKILISGGNRDPNVRPEALQLKSILLLAGVPEADILCEERSINTYENAQFAAEILRKKFAGQRYLLITSAFHMRRAVACFAKAGVDVSPFPTDFYAVRRQNYWLQWIAPSEQALALWGVLIHECLGYIVYDILDYL